MGLAANARGRQSAGVDKKAEMQRDFRSIMGLLSDHFKEHDFLLGGRACLADFALAGTAQAHFLVDPEPRSWLGEHEGMLEDYVARVYRGGDESQSYSFEKELPQTLIAILKHALDNYQRFAMSSIMAAAKGEKYFTLDLGHGEFTARSMRRLDKARLHVQNEILKAKIEASDFQEIGILEHYLKPKIVAWSEDSVILTGTNIQQFESVKDQL